MVPFLDQSKIQFILIEGSESYNYETLSNSHILKHCRLFVIFAPNVVFDACEQDFPLEKSLVFIRHLW
jgi:hypothetical protein